MRIIQDTREQEPWDFSFYGVDTVVRKLDTGDYSVEGLEDILCIERKKSTGEIAINLGSKNATFVKELERMRSFKAKYLIFEFSIQTLLSFPALSGIPKSGLSKIRMNAGYIVKLLQKYEEEYNIEIIYCNSKAQANEVAYDIMKENYERFQK